VNVVVAAAHGAPLTVIVSTTVAPDVLSAALNVYVGVNVVPLEITPRVPEVVVADHEIVPFAAEYPAGSV
jgi:hypothetical protein